MACAPIHTFLEVSTPIFFKSFQIQTGQYFVQTAVCVPHNHRRNNENERNKKYEKALGPYSTTIPKIILCFILHEVLRDSVVRCVARNLEVPGSSHNDPVGLFLAGMSLDNTLQSPSVVLVKPRK